jgi:hypothetical protein
MKETGIRTAWIVDLLPGATATRSFFRLFAGLHQLGVRLPHVQMRQHQITEITQHLRVIVNARLRDEPVVMGEQTPRLRRRITRFDQTFRLHVFQARLGEIVTRS